MVKVSVIITTYNRRDMVKRAIDSVLAQTFNDYELIIVDDGSTDNTYDAIQAYRGPNVATYRLNQNTDHANAINYGLNYCKGEYIAFLDDDDEWMPDALENLVQTMDRADSKVGIVYGWHRVVYNGVVQKRINGSKLNGNIYNNMLSMHLPSPTSAYLVRAVAMRKVGGFNTEYNICDDLLFVRRLVEHGYHVQHVPIVVMNKHQHENRKTSYNTPSLMRRKKVVEDHMQLYKTELHANKWATSMLLLRLANWEIKMNNKAKFVILMMQSFKHCPHLTVKKSLQYIFDKITRNPSME